MRRRPRWELAVIVAASGFSAAAPLASYRAAEVCASTGRATPPSAVVNAEGTLAISGGIDDAMLAAVGRAVAAAQYRVTLVRIDSFGGQERAAEQLGQALSSLGAPIEVPAGASCQSACVGVLARSSGTVSVAPTGTLMFHSEASRVGLSEEDGCGFVNRLLVQASMAIHWVGRHLGTERPPLMLAWAEHLSERLPVVFGLCRSNPLYGQSGMVLTGAELGGLRDGSLSPSALAARRCAMRD